LRHACQALSLEELISPELLKHRAQKRLECVRRVVRLVSNQIKAGSSLEAISDFFSSEMEGTLEEKDCWRAKEVLSRALEEVNEEVLSRPPLLEAPDPVINFLRESDIERVKAILVRPLCQCEDMLKIWLEEAKAFVDVAESNVGFRDSTTNRRYLLGKLEDKGAIGGDIKTSILPGAPLNFINRRDLLGGKSVSEMDLAGIGSEGVSSVTVSASNLNTPFMDKEGGAENVNLNEGALSEFQFHLGSRNLICTERREDMGYGDKLLAIQKAALLLREEWQEVRGRLSSAWKELHSLMLLQPQRGILSQQKKFIASALASVSSAVRALPPSSLESISLPLPIALQGLALKPPQHSAMKQLPRAYHSAIDLCRFGIQASVALYQPLPGGDSSSSLPLSAVPFISLPTTEGSKKTQGKNRNVGLHVVIFVHGMGGSRFDLRLVKAWLKLHHPQLLTFSCTSLEALSHGDIMAAGAALAEEVAGFCGSGGGLGGGESLGKLSFVAFSLGGVWVRTALRHPKLSPFLPHLHTFITIATPHLGFPHSETGSSILSAGTYLAKLWSKNRNVALEQIALQDSHLPSLTLISRLSKGWLEDNTDLEHSPSDASEGDQPSPSLHGFSSYPTGTYLSLFKHVILMASPQDSWAPFVSSMACADGGGFFEGLKGGEGGYPRVQRVSVLFHSLKDVNLVRSTGEGTFGEGGDSLLFPPKDEAMSRAPPLSIAAATGQTLLSALDKVSGRDAHLAFCASEGVAALIALGLGQEVWGV